LLIIFDLDDTILDTSGTIIPSRLRDAHAMVAEGEFEQMLRLNETAPSSKHSLIEFIEINDLEPKLLPKMRKVMNKATCDDVTILPFEHAFETLRVLAKDFSLALVTAGSDQLQNEKINQTKMPRELFSKIMICEDGSKEGCYASILNEFDIDPSLVIVCGDRVKSDLVPAKNLGMHTVHILQGRGRHNERPEGAVDFTIRHLREICPIAEQIHQYNKIGVYG